MSNHAQISAAGGIPPAERPARQTGKENAAVGGFPFQSLLNAGAMANAQANFALRANQQIVLNLTSELSTGRETIRESQRSAQDSAPRAARSENHPADTTTDPIDDFDSTPVTDDVERDQALADTDAAPIQIPPKDVADLPLNGARTDVADGAASRRSPLPTGDQSGLNANRDAGAPVSRPTEQPADLPLSSNGSPVRESALRSEPRETARPSAAGQAPLLRVAEVEQTLSQVHRTPVHISVVDNPSRLVSGPSAALHRSTDITLQSGATTVTTAASSNGQNGTQTGGQNAGSQNNPQHGFPLGVAAAAQTAGAGISGLGSQVPGEGKTGFTTTVVNSLGSQTGSLQSGSFTGQIPSAPLPSASDARGTTPSSITRNSASVPTPVRAAPHEIGVHITRAAQAGIDRIAIDLKPETLGRIEVRLDLGQDGRVSALFLADSRETLDMLRADARALQQNLQDAGLKTDGQSLQFDLRSQHGGTQRENAPLPHVDLSHLRTDSASTDELAASSTRYTAGYTPVFSDNQINVLA